MKSSFTRKASNMMERSKRWLEDSEVALDRGNFDNAIYMAQMSVESSTKAVLLLFGLDYPKEHDVSGPFRQLLDRSDPPEWFKEEIPTISDVIHTLAEIRGLAAYGYEHNMTVQDFEGKAPKYLEKAKRTYEQTKRLLAEVFHDR